MTYSLWSRKAKWAHFFLFAMTTFLTAGYFLQGLFLPKNRGHDFFMGGIFAYFLAMKILILWMQRDRTIELSDDRIRYGNPLSEPSIDRPISDITQIVRRKFLFDETIKLTFRDGEKFEFDFQYEGYLELLAELERRTGLMAMNGRGKLMETTA